MQRLFDHSVFELFLKNLIYEIYAKWPIHRKNLLLLIQDITEEEEQSIQRELLISAILCELNFNQRNEESLEAILQKLIPYFRNLGGYGEMIAHKLEVDYAPFLAHFKKADDDLIKHISIKLIKNSGSTKLYDSYLENHTRCTTSLAFIVIGILSTVEYVKGDLVI